MAPKTSLTSLVIDGKHYRAVALSPGESASAPIGITPGAQVDFRVRATADHSNAAVQGNDLTVVVSLAGHSAPLEAPQNVIYRESLHALEPLPGGWKKVSVRLPALMLGLWKLRVAVESDSAAAHRVIWANPKFLWNRHDGYLNANNGFRDSLGEVMSRLFELHPFLGWVQSPFDTRSANRFGYPGNEPPRHRSKDTVVIGFTGGSVADDMLDAAESVLEQELQNSPAFAGKHVKIVRLAMGAYRQPIQLSVLSYFLALGGVFDIFINLDGSQRAHWRTRLKRPDFSVPRSCARMARACWVAAHTRDAAARGSYWSRSRAAQSMGPAYAKPSVSSQRARRLVMVLHRSKNGGKDWSTDC